jgi:hypothetical protein
VKGPALTINATSPASASSVAYFARFVDTRHAPVEKLVVEATLRGAEGGDLDLYLQRREGPTWHDLIHLGRVCAGSATKRCTHMVDRSEIGCGEFRILFVAGAGTSAGAPATITITPFLNALLN